MSSEPSKEHARRAFEALGFDVQEIHESVVVGEQRADLLATRGTESFLIEAKGKEPHQAYRELSERGAGSITRDVKPWRSLAKVIERAAGQLRVTPVGDITARLFWISALHDDWEFLFDAFRMRLLGSVELSCFRPSDAELPLLDGIKTCYYFYTPDLARFTSIDGIIFAGPKGAQLVLSEFGALASRLRGSRLCEEAREIRSVVDVPQRVASGEALVIREPSARISNRARWEYLKETFGLLTSLVITSDFHGLVSVPFKDAD